MDSCLDVITEQATCRKSADGRDILLMIIITGEEKQRAPVKRCRAAGWRPGQMLGEGSCYLAQL